MHPEIERLIDIAFADGIVTEKERSVILRKAESLGLDKDEVEMFLEAKIHQFQEKKQTKPKEKVDKCPSCGEIIVGLSQVCNACGYFIKKPEESNNLHSSIHQLEQLIVDIKSVPKPSIIDRIKVAVFTYFTAGLYLLFRNKKSNEVSFENLVAKCQKEARSIKIYYGDDRKVISLLDELNDEINKIVTERKKLNSMYNIGCLSLVIAVIIFYIILFSIMSF